MNGPVYAESSADGSRPDSTAHTGICARDRSPSVAIDAADVPLGRPTIDDECVGNLTIGPPAGDETQRVTFPVSQLPRRPDWCTYVLEMTWPPWAMAWHGATSV